MSKGQKLRTRPRVRVHMLQVSQNAVQLLHTPLADGSSGTNDNCTLSSNNAGSIPAPSAPQDIIPDVPLSQNAIHMPDEWALPWSNVLLRERIEEREREPGCGGGLARSKYHEVVLGLNLAHLTRKGLPKVSAADPGASFIARNALNDLAYFTFEREAQFLERSDRSDRIAFSVIDFDRRRQVNLDTSSCSGLAANSSERKEVLRILFSQVPSHTVWCRSVLDKLRNVCLEIG